MERPKGDLLSGRVPWAEAGAMEISSRRDSGDDAGRMTHVAHEHGHGRASHEESQTAGGGGMIDAMHQDPSHAAGVIYTCPMHPQIRQIGPRNCPICGMTLEPLVASTEAEPNAELIDMTRRFWIGLALTASKRRRCSFDPRSREGATRLVGLRRLGGIVSIHAPVKERHSTHADIINLIEFRSRSREGATWGEY